MNKLQVTKFSIDDIVLIFGDGTTDTIPSSNINHFTIEKDFIQDYLPVFIIKCNVDYDLYKKINKHGSLLKYKVNVKKFNIPANAYNVKDNIIVNKSFISDIFENVNTVDKSPNLYENIIKEKNSYREDERPDIEKSAMNIDLILFKQDNLKDYRTNTKYIYNNTQIAPVMIDLLDSANKSNCLMSYPDNRDNYDNIIIPNNLTLIGAMEYLQNVYGIYNTGLLLFNDFKRSYIINKAVRSNAYEKNEYKTIYIHFNDATTAQGNLYGITYNNSDSCTITCQSHPNAISNKDEMGLIAYDKLQLINTFTGSNIVKNITDNTKNPTIKIIDDKYDNKYAANSFIYDLNLNNTILEIQFNEIDLELITPNKEYYINFNINDKNISKLNGFYKLVKITSVFEKQDETTFYNSAIGLFKRA